MSFCSQKHEPESKPRFITHFLLRNKIAELEQINKKLEEDLQTIKKSNELMRKEIEEIGRCTIKKNDSFSQTDEIVYQIIEAVLSDKK